METDYELDRDLRIADYENDQHVACQECCRVLCSGELNAYSLMGDWQEDGAETTCRVCRALDVVPCVWC